MPRRILQTAKKLRGRTPDEFRVRGVQALHRWLERSRISPRSRLPDDDAFLRVLSSNGGSSTLSPAELLERFRGRGTPPIHGNFANRAALITELRGRWPDEKEAVIERAERILGGRFDLLGWTDLSFGDPIDWHLDPVHERGAPLEHWSRIPFLDAAEVGDHKLIWELNRHQYFLTLGKAYLYTDDERYADCFVDHLESWMDANPPKRGINWASSLEVAYRAIAWIWALHFFRDSDGLTPGRFLRIAKFLELHGNHVETYLSTYFSPNTHLTGEALGLVYLGTTFPEMKRAERWTSLGWRILLDQLDRHVEEDGVYFERSTYYHRYTTDIYLHARLLGSAEHAPDAAKEAIPGIDAGLRKLLDHLMYISKPDGTTPLVGDDDGGRLLPLDSRRRDDFRAALATGAVLFGREDYAFVADEPAEETLWLLGSEGPGRFDSLRGREPKSASRPFRSGGFFVMRDGWNAEANYMLLDCGPHGAMNGGHAHSDMLGFELAARGRTVLVDPGTYTYTADPALRDHFRSTAAHNTLTVEGLSASVPDGPFGWGHVADPHLRSWISEKRFDFFEGAHDGYARLTPPAIHQRSVLFLRSSYWIVCDRVISTAPRHVELRFQLAPGLRLHLEDHRAVAEPDVESGAPALGIVPFGAMGQLSSAEGEVSSVYGERTPAPVCRYSVEGRGNQELVTFLLPPGPGGELPDVEEHTAAGGRAFEVLTPDFRDVFLVTTGEHVEYDGVSSNFRWTWIRRGRNHGDEVLKYVLVGGNALQVDGRDIFHSVAPAEYAAGSMDGDE